MIVLFVDSGKGDVSPRIKFLNKGVKRIYSINRFHSMSVKWKIPAAWLVVTI